MDLYSQFTWLSQVLRPQFSSDAGSESNAEHSAEIVSQSRNTNDKFINRINETSNVYTSANIDSNAANGCRQTIDYIQLMKQFNQNNEHFLAALLKKGSSPTAALASASQHKQQTVALIPPTPPRTPITSSAAQQQVSSHAKPYHFKQQQSCTKWSISINEANTVMYTVRPITIQFFQAAFAHSRAFHFVYCLIAQCFGTVAQIVENKCSKPKHFVLIFLLFTKFDLRFIALIAEN